MVEVASERGDWREVLALHLQALQAPRLIQAACSISAFSMLKHLGSGFVQRRSQRKGASSTATQPRDWWLPGSGHEPSS